MQIEFPVKATIASVNDAAGYPIAIAAFDGRTTRERAAIAKAIAYLMNTHEREFRNALELAMADGE